MDPGAWRATVHGVARVRHNLANNHHHHIKSINSVTSEPRIYNGERIFSSINNVGKTEQPHAIEC